MRFIVAIACLMGLPAAAWTQQDAGSPWIETRYHRVHLRNGNTIDGQLVNDGKNALVLKVKVGEMQIRKDMIDHVEMVRMRSLKEAPEIKPVTREPSAPERPPAPDMAKPIDPKAAPPVSPAALKVPAEVREQIDGVIHAWIASRQGDLAQQLEPLPPEGVPYLCALLDEKPRRVPAIPLCAVLGRQSNPAAIPSLGRVLLGGSLDEREAAAAALTEMSMAETVPYLLQSMQDTSNRVWRAASRGLLDLHKRFPQAGIDKALLSGLESAKDKLPFTMTVGALEGEDSYRALIYMVRTGEDRDRLTALQGLSGRLLPEDADLVVTLLRSPTRPLRQQACAALAKVKHKPAVLPLIEMLSEEDVGIVGDAHRALQQITGETLARDANLWRQWWEVAGRAKFEK